MDNKIPDEKLVQLARTKNPDLFSQIVKRYEKKIIGYLYRLVGVREDAEDLAQDTFLKVYKNLQGFDIERKFSSWIYRIAHNEAVNFLRAKTKFKIFSLDATDFFKNTLGVDERICEKMILDDEVKHLKNLVRQLPIEYREVIVLKFFEEKSYEEMSDILRKPISTIGTLVRRAKIKLSNLSKNNMDQ